MAKHKFDGNWRYAEMDFKHFPPAKPNKPGLLGKMELNIPNDATGDLDVGSKHDMAPLTGKATADAITMNEKDVGGGTETDYEGHLVTPEVPGHLVIVGSFTRKNKPLPSALAEDRESAAELGQDEGIWIITKP